MPLVLKEHQKIALALVTEHDRFLLLPEQGTGKTLVMLVHMSNLYLSGEIKNALVVSTSAGLHAWYRDIEKLSADRKRMIRENTQFVNYEKLSRKDGKWQVKFWKPWDMLVLDESHAIKKPTSNRAQYFVGKGKALGLSSRAKYRYLLTGTLITNSHLED